MEEFHLELNKEQLNAIDNALEKIMRGKYEYSLVKGEIRALEDAMEICNSILNTKRDNANMDFVVTHGIKQLRKLYHALSRINNEVCSLY